MVVETRQNFRFFRQNAWFLSRALSKFLNGILHCLISITKLPSYKSDQSVKHNFVLITRATLNDCLHLLLNQKKWQKQML